MTDRAIRRLAALGLTLGLASGSTWAARDLAGELRDAQAALAAADYPKAYQAYLEHSAHNPLAQFTLGLFHQYGWGRPADQAEACRWQERAAPGGIPAAQLLLADCLRQGVHRPADLGGAAHWYEQAAASGIPTAQCALAELVMAGQGVPKDPRKAIALCGQAAEKGLPRAQLRLARFHLEGEAEVRDPAAAWKWMQAAAQANDAEAQYRLGLMLRDGVGRAPEPESGRWWLEAAAGQGYLPAYLPTAQLYLAAPPDPETRLLPAQDLAKAYLWLAAAVQRLSPGESLDQARTLLHQVREGMPETWRPTLDQRVAEHLARIGQGAAAAAATTAPAVSARQTSPP